MNRSLAVTIWFVINVIFLSILGYHHYMYSEQGYVVEGRGNKAKIITKQENPEYYKKRMKYIWAGYILLPVLSACGIYTKGRPFKRQNNKTPNLSLESTRKR